MKKGRFTEEQIAYALRQTESGTKAAEICRKLGVSEPTFYTWKRKDRGLGVSELRKLTQLEGESEAEDARRRCWAGTSWCAIHRPSMAGRCHLIVISNSSF